MHHEILEKKTRTAFELLGSPRLVNNFYLAGGISSRGTKKDFVDLFFLLHTISLQDLLTLFEKKYRRISYNLAHVLKSIVYFEDARSEPEPTMLLPYSWKEIERTLEQQIKTLL